MGEFCMPSLGADMETGTLVEWLAAPGTQVKRGDIVAVVETQKGLFEIEVFEDGVLGPALVQAGTTVPVGTVLAVITPDSAAAEIGTDEPVMVEVKEKPPATTSARSPQPPLAPAQKGSRAKRISASPSARRLAGELGVDLAQVHGTGPQGAIRREDVTLAAREGATPLELAAQTAEQPPAVVNAGGMREAIAAAMSRSNREIPHYYLEMEIDMNRPLQWLETENRNRSLRERVLPAALLLKATALAVREVPELNGYWLDDQLQVKEHVHIGFAVALRQGGLITPAIHDVDTLRIDQVMQAMADLIERSRSSRLRSSEMTDATITMTNLGDRGVKTVFGLIYPPQVALVGLGRIMERPWVDGGVVCVHRCLTATLAGDHRATDGHQGARFLEALNRYLQQPEAL